MELTILKENFEINGIIDAYESLIWTDRYYEHGDFELLAPPNANNVQAILQGSYARIDESDHIMLIEDVHIETDPVDGNRMTIKGRSGEILLDRRTIVAGVEFSQISIDTVVHQLVTECILVPVGPNPQLRVITNFSYKVSEDPNVLNVLVSNQYWQNLLYPSIVEMCYNSGIGWKVTLSDAGIFQVELYAGQDRTYEQLDNPYVVFSPDFENLKNSTYMATTRLLRTVCYTGGEKGVGNIQSVVEVDPSLGTILGINRREMYLDAQDVGHVDEEGNELTEEEYEAHLYQRGLEELAKNTALSSFSSEVDPTNNFVYDRDFFLGDILQVENEYGYAGRSRVVEVTRCQDRSGFKVYPIFSAI